MNIQPSKLFDITSSLSSNTAKETNNKDAFENFFNKALKLVEDTNELQKKAQKASLDFAMGKIDNIHSVTIAQNKAEVALQFTVQVRDKLLDAYNEIMRMPI